ncbi:MAG: MFS transporter [Bacteroidota bacterium]|nr:MFS transporter [Bacteroidota bacterium]
MEKKRLNLHFFSVDMNMVKGLTNREKQTFKLHMIYSILEGVVLGVLALNEFVFIKSINGSNYQLGFLFQFSMIVFLFLIFINEFLKRSKNKRRLLRIEGMITRLPMFGIAFFPHTPEAFSGDSIYHYIFLAIFLVYFLGHPIEKPLINLFLKSNYRHKNFGLLYSYATTANKVVMLVVTFAYGMLLDVDNYAFIYVFPVVATLSIASIFILSNIKYTPKKLVEESEVSFFKSIKKSAKRMYCILKTNHSYRHFEIGFMLYGFAFMTTVTVIYIFFDEELHLNYSSVAFYRNSYNIIAIATLPFFGKLLGALDPRKFGVITYLSLALYLFFLAITQYFPYYTTVFSVQIYYTLILYIVFHGFFAATMPLLWNIGSAYFGDDDDADIYQSIHLWLTGLRAVFAPLSGVFFYEVFGFTFSFALAISALIIAIFVMKWSYNKRFLHADLKPQTTGT